MQTRSTNDVVTPDDDNNNDNDNDFSNCSTPYVSAPSSPSNNHNQNQFRPASSAFFFYSAPSSPMHYVARSHLTPSASDTAAPPSLSSPSSPTSFDFEFEFEFGSSFDSPAPSADELFLNGQIRPFKLHDIISEEHEHEYDDTNDQDIIIRRSRSEDAMLCGSRSQRRRTRSMSPLRSATPFDDEASSSAEKAVGEEEAPSGSSSRCSSAGRSSKRWVFLKDFLRSKSEGRSNNKFWHTFSSPASKEKEKYKTTTTTKNKVVGTAAAEKRRSAHEMHYAANRAQAEEMRKKTFLPYRQGLLGCLGFNSKSYGALHGFARALNPVSSR